MAQHTHQTSLTKPNVDLQERHRTHRVIVARWHALSQALVERCRLLEGAFLLMKRNVSGAARPLRRRRPDMLPPDGRMATLRRRSAVLACLIFHPIRRRCDGRRGPPPRVRLRSSYWAPVLISGSEKTFRRTRSTRPRPHPIFRGCFPRAFVQNSFSNIAQHRLAQFSRRQHWKSGSVGTSTSWNGATRASAALLPTSNTRLPGTRGSGSCTTTESTTTGREGKMYES